MAIPNPELEEAMSVLLPDVAGQPSYQIRDLCRAAKAALKRREDNTRHGGAVLAEMHRQGLSWREIAASTGIPRATAARWADPMPGGAR